ncbi:DUF4926 domain-containing protein [Thauera sp.]|jgi:hypothetical protein|uniref:DUF4926 domain-containing protein n=1 Tax=Thauera sp. TaxID=1905334 RepID=UPI00257AA087|nr:DUF4926 domain-containing protein [Thauera sp.]
MKTLDVVATLSEYPERGIGAGQVGTVIEELDADHVLVEFAHLDSVTYAIAPIRVRDLIQLKHTSAAWSG